VKYPGTRVIEPQFLQMPWGRFAYRRSGRGTPFVLIHPLALNSTLWEPTLGELSPGHDLIMIDARGHGASTWNGEPYAIADIASDVRVLLDALRIDRCAMLGMSMGGCIAMTFAARNRTRVDKLMLCDTTAWYGEDAPAKWEERALAAETKSRDAQIPFQLDRWFSEAFRNADPDTVEHAANAFRSTAPEAHAAACRALARFDLRDEISGIDASTLVVTGESDYATPPAMGSALANGIRGAQFRLVAGVRHMAVLESAALRRELATFARSQIQG
jgi:3-oxoadipate enol-lactonase